MATTADYLNKLITQKNTLADNLVTKGVTATHDETLETLVPKVLDISGGSDKYYIYNNGQELNDNAVTLYHVNGSSKKTASWIYMYYWYRGVIETSQLSLGGCKKIGVCVNLKRNGPATPFFTKMSLRSSSNVELSGNDYIPMGDIIGTEYALIDNTIDSTVTKYEGIYYIDVPDGADSGYFVIDSVNVDVYVIGIWLEKENSQDDSKNIEFIGKIKNLCIYNPANPYSLSGTTDLSTNYLINNDNSNFVFAPNNNDWEICIKFNMNSLKNNSALIGCAYGNNYWSTPSIEYLNDTVGLWFGISTSGSSWTFGGTTGSIESGKDYWVKLSYSSSNGYKFYLSENGIDYEVKYETSVTDVQYQNESISTMQLFNVANSAAHLASTSVIDLRETYIKFGNEIVWGSKLNG